MPLLPDYLFTLFLALLIGFFLRRYAQRQQLAGRGAIYQFLLPAYAAKLFGFAVAILILAQFYDWGNDGVATYYGRVIQLKKLLAGQPFYLWKYAFWGLEEQEIAALSLPTYYGELKGTNQLVRFSLWLSYLCADRFLLMSFCCTLLAFLGCWRFFLFGQSLYPPARWPWAIACLFLPSVLYWGGGLSKEAFVMLGLGLFFPAFYQVFIQRCFSYAAFAALLLGLFLLVSVKVYIFLLLLPSLALWYIAQRWQSGRYSFYSWLRLLAASVFSVLLVFLSLAYVYPRFGANVGSELAEQLAHWRTVAAVDSSYRLPYLQPTLGSFLLHYPWLFITALFRPFVWEAKHYLIALASLETLGVLFLSIHVFVRLGFRSFLKRLFKDPFLLALSSFLLLFFPLVAAASGNFGTLVRYKLPGLMLYVLLLLLLLKREDSAAT